MLLTVSLPEKWGYCAGGGRGLETSRRENNIINQDVCTGLSSSLDTTFNWVSDPGSPMILWSSSKIHRATNNFTFQPCLYRGTCCLGFDIELRWVSQFQASHYATCCRVSAELIKQFAISWHANVECCRSRQSLRTVLWMGCKNFIMLPSLLIAIQHYNMMNVAGKDYCNRFDVEKSE